jgi:hypothetical protein
MNEKAGQEPGEIHRDALLAAMALVIGIVFDWLFYGKPAGISYPLFLSLWVVFLIRGLRCRITLKLDFSLFLLLASGLLAMAFALFTNPVLRALNLAAVPVLTVMYVEQAAGLHDARLWGPQSIAAAIRRICIRGIASMPAAIRIPVVRIRQHQDAARYQILMKISVGLLLSLPLVIVAAALLSSADMLFQRTLQQVPDWFGNVPVGEVLFRGLVILIAASYTFGLMWSMRKDTGKSRDAGVEGIVFEPEPEPEHVHRKVSRAALVFDPIITATVLISINTVYVLFTAVQFAYLFGGGGDGVLPDGATYAEYARRGFGEVVFVSILNFGIMMGALYVTKASVHAAVRLVRLVLILLLGNTLVMLISAFIRLSMYEAAYGYTYTRFFVHAFLLWLGVMLVLMLVKIVRPGKGLFRAAFILTVAAYIALNYVNMDAIIASRNIERYHSNGRIDWSYLNRLSYDAVPVLMKLAQAERVRTPLAEEFAKKKERLAHEASLTSFNLAKYRAKRLLEE